MHGDVRLAHRFVTYIPETLELGVVYVSVEFATVVHACCCGCGSEVVTPLSPSDWKLTFDGETVSLIPSIGNWSFPCQSHYWITRNTVRWARRWTPEEIAAGRAYDASTRAQHADRADAPTDTRAPEATVLRPSLWRQLRQWLSRFR